MFERPSAKILDPVARRRENTPPPTMMQQSESETLSCHFTVFQQGHYVIIGQETELPAFM